MWRLIPVKNVKTKLGNVLSKFVLQFSIDLEAAGIGCISLNHCQKYRVYQRFRQDILKLAIRLWLKPFFTYLMLTSNWYKNNFPTYFTNVKFKSLLHTLGWLTIIICQSLDLRFADLSLCRLLLKWTLK